MSLAQPKIVVDSEVPKEGHSPCESERGKGELDGCVGGLKQGAIHTAVEQVHKQERVVRADTAEETQRAVAEFRSERRGPSVTRSQHV